MDDETLADGWSVWNEERHKVILTYRPDVFNSEAYPAPCLPTIHLQKGGRSRKPGRNTPDSDDPWQVTLYLEPDVSMKTERFDDRTGAAKRARSLTEQFTAGEIDYRSLYQVPRPDYVDRLDELTG